MSNDVSKLMKYAHISDHITTYKSSTQMLFSSFVIWTLTEQDMEDKDIKCEICGITFWSKWSRGSAKSNLTRHMREVHASPQSLQCQDCGKRFSRKDKLQSHVKTQHREDKQSFSCSQCEKSFTQKDNLKRHVSDVHKEEQRFYCPECPEDFSRLENLKRHEERGKHSVLHDCSYCYRMVTFKSKEALDKHIFRDSGILTCRNAKYAIGKMPTREDKQAHWKRSSERDIKEDLKTRAKDHYHRFTDGSEDYDIFEERFIREEGEKDKKLREYFAKRSNNEYDADKSMLDPISKDPIQEPVRHKKCGHVYDKESFIEMTKRVDDLICNGHASGPVKEGYGCRVKSCSSRIICLDDLEPDADMAAEIERRRIKKREEKEEKKRKEDEEYAREWERRKRNREEREKMKKKRKE